MKVHHYIIILISLIFLTCGSKKWIADKTVNMDLSLQNINYYISLESQRHAQDVTRDYFVDVSEEIYPFIKNHHFEIPKEFVSAPQAGIEHRNSYYYTKDGDVKLILYHWNEANDTKSPTGTFQLIFSKLESNLESILGPNTYKNLESRFIKTDRTFRDDVKWENGLTKAYLFRFGDKANFHNEIILAVYK